VQRDDVLWLSLGVPNHRKPSSRGDNLPVTPDETLRIFVRIALSLKKFRIARCATVSFIWVHYLVPILHGAQVLMRAAQHFLQRFIGVELPGWNIENADPYLGVLEDRAEEPLARLLIFLDKTAITIAEVLTPVIPKRNADQIMNGTRV